MESLTLIYCTDKETADAVLEFHACQKSRALNPTEYLKPLTPVHVDLTIIPVDEFFSVDMDAESISDADFQQMISAIYSFLSGWEAGRRAHLFLASV